MLLRTHTHTRSHRCADTHTHTQSHTHTYTHNHQCADTHTHTLSHTHTYTYTQPPMCRHTHLHTHTFTDTLTYRYTHTQSDSHTHTHTHIHGFFIFTDLFQFVPSPIFSGAALVVHFPSPFHRFPLFPFPSVSPRLSRFLSVPRAPLPPPSLQRGVVLLSARYA